MRHEAGEVLAAADREIAEGEKLLWNVGYFARRAGVNRNTVRRWIRDNRVVAVRLPNGYFRIPQSEFERILPK